MTAHAANPDQEPTLGSGTKAVSDAPADNWVDRYAPVAWRPYLRLARMDRPIGTWLLLFPCWWSVTLAEVSNGRPYPNLGLLALFALGAIVMRGAGCAFNDYVDREYDARVARTASRPIPSGQVTPEAALAFVAALSLIGFLVLIWFNTFTILLGVASLGLVVIYPYMKRFTHWPQAVLGLAFNWGALMGWAAVKGSLALPPLLLYAGSVLWTIGYDTIYAHQDADDDAVLGLKSTALTFGQDTPFWVGSFYAGALLLWIAAGFLAGTHLVFFFGMALVGLQMAWQVSTLDTSDPKNCLRRFRANRDVGVAIFLALVTDTLLSWWAGLS
ncbi:4-hydroxybenzoate octaprenyltransferase [Hyphomicrobium sp.]|uniref:4-hydroxybenzoate octaprenyltransferase n=1 Tax=Hyphomicrobium sp. TaxID=82 RepID=UPI002FE02823